MDFLKKYQKWIFGALIFLALLWAVYELTKTESSPYAPGYVGPDAIIDPLFDANNIAIEFRLALKGPTGSAAFQSAMEMLLNLSDSEFIATNNAFRSIYGEDEYPTLRSYIGNEWPVITSTSINLRNQVYDRLTRIGI